MIAIALLLALQPGAVAPGEADDCAPRRVLTRGGPPPPLVHARRVPAGPGENVYLSVHRCRSGGLRVERFRDDEEEGAASDEALEWVPIASCPALGPWFEAVAALRLPSPMLRPHALRRGPYRGTWFTLAGRARAGSGQATQFEITTLDPPGAEPNAVSGWMLAGERLFQQCRDRGQGGQGWLSSRPARTP